MKDVVFVQQSPALAGSQKSLLRLMRALEKPWRPILVTGSEGWLADQSRSSGIPVIVQPFSSSRSLLGRLIGNRQFGRRIAKECCQLKIAASIVHANDHIQSLTALAIARALRIPSVLTLRSIGMLRRDFTKYRCNSHKHLVAVGDLLFGKVSTWHGQAHVSLVENGLGKSEFRPDFKVPAECPAEVVVLGSLHPGKGWGDLVEALTLLETQGIGKPITFSFLGNDFGRDFETELGVNRLKIFRTRHLPLAINFVETVGKHSLAVHPSRAESFGMALLETLAAGVPVLTSRVGVAEKVVTSDRFLFKPQDARELAAKLAALMGDFSGAADLVSEAQRKIRRLYSIQRTAVEYTRLYHQLAPD